VSRVNVLSVFRQLWCLRTRDWRDSLGIDTQTPADFAIQVTPERMPLQGNLDPQVLIVGGEAMDAAARDVIASFKGAPHVFNLGHGITPQATPENVERLINVVKARA
jgi:uroporphyrinogen decarboxylase